MEAEVLGFEALLLKYAGGRMPPLVDVETPEQGLIDPDLLRIYHSGIQSRLPPPFRILLAAHHFTSPHEKWQKGDFVPSEWSPSHWSPFCKMLRATQPGEATCEACDRRKAITADEHKDVLSYLCRNGMIDSATPILVKDQVIAIVFCGQFKPKEGSIWNPELLQPDGLFRPLSPMEEGVDVWADVSLQRIHSTAQRAGLSAEELLGSLSGGVMEVSPQQVEEYQALLRRTAVQISNLAMSTYELEKGKVVDQIRDYITRSLEPLDAALETSEVWRRLSLGLEYLVRYFDLDYALMLSCCNGIEGGIKVLCQSGLPVASFPIEEEAYITTDSLSTLKSNVCGLLRPTPIPLGDYKNLPFFDQLYHLHRAGERVLIIPLPTPLESSLPILILGRFEREIELSAFFPGDREALNRIVEAITLVSDTILLIDQLERMAKRRADIEKRLEEAVKKQAWFLEDVAHAIKTPIQNIIVGVEALSSGSTSPEKAKHLAQRIAAQVRRLHLLSERVWTLANIDRGLFKREETEQVDVYQIIMEQRKSLLDLAKERRIEISVDRELEDWPLIQVNRELFTQAILNLIDNAVKYSRDGIEVRVDGKRVPSDIVDGKPVPGGIMLSFVNRGIPVKEKDKDRIFDRYYRADEATRLTPTGTGIGLAIVKGFVDYYNGSVETNSVPILGTRDYVTEFRMFIPQGGW